MFRAVRIDSNFKVKLILHICMQTLILSV